MNEQPPEIVLFAGPNGAGKSTFARFALPEAMPFVNADEIAKTLPASSANPELEAGRLLLERINDLSQSRKSFALETTLASRSLAPRITQMQKVGYQFRLLFLWLPSADLARARVAARVRRGGHDIPTATIDRRFEAGLRNFFALYQPLADEWFVFDNTQIALPRLIARGGRQKETTVNDADLWARVEKQGNHNV